VVFYCLSQEHVSAWLHNTVKFPFVFVISEKIAHMHIILWFNADLVRKVFFPFYLCGEVFWVEEGKSFMVTFPQNYLDCPQAHQQQPSHGLLTEC
jgi:hypothetical protein